MSGKPIVGSLKAQKVKNKGKKISKNILTFSEDLIWPMVNEETAEIINCILKKSISVLKNCRPKIPWYTLMKLTKEQRKERIQEEINNLPTKDKDTIILSRKARRHVAIGVNSCLRLMDQEKLLFCLIDPSVQPKLLVDKILALAKEKHIVTALIPNLITTLNSTLGFDSFIIGFKLSLEENDCHIKECLEIKKILDQLNLKLWQEIKEDEEPKSSIKVMPAQERLSDIYLYRADNNRVFRPKPDVNIVSDFIQMSVDKSKNLEEKSKNKSGNMSIKAKHKNGKPKKFKSPLVLTVQNNPNKKRKKQKKLI